MKIVFATGNEHKLKEINAISKNSGIEFVLPDDGFDPNENGTTFLENSLIKAQEAAKVSKCMSLADDSGLCVEALNGEPGVYSARYDETPQKRIDKLLKNMQGKTNRNAKFVCAMSLVDEHGNIITQQVGECHGEISETQFGTNGFGYDPIFVVNGRNKTMAELTEDEKNNISHRSVALCKIIDYLRNENYLK